MPASGLGAEMGLVASAMLRIFELTDAFQPTGRTLMLGRQNLMLQRSGRRALRRVFARSPERRVSLDEMLETGPYSEGAFELLGIRNIESLDYSDYEGATIVHDLNQPVAEELHGQFDFIYDGGTLEHVFHVPNALANVFHMLRPGGIFVAATPLNGWAGHGFYQFGPDLVWSYWGRAAGCTVLRCIAQPSDLRRRAWDLPDTIDQPERYEMTGKLSKKPMLMYFEVRKEQDSVLTGVASQSDYANAWSSGSHYQHPTEKPRVVQ